METISRNVEDLMAFHQVATEGSFTRAAETLGTSKAMVSKQVKRLETYTRSQLFQRTTRTLNLTEQGIALFSYSQKIFSLTDEASRRLRDMSQGSSGVVRISAPVSLGELIMPTLLPKVRPALPHVQFELDLSNENRDFVKDGIDFALRATETHHPDLTARYLGRIRDVICASPAFLKKNKIAKDPKMLVKQPCILHSQEQAWNTWTLNSKDEEVRLEVAGLYATNQYPMARLLCLQGLGIVRIPLYLVSDDIEKGDLVPLFSEFQITTHPLFLVYLRSEFATKKHKITKELILEWFNENKDFFLIEN